jgi:hypothetical protein
MWRVEVFSQGKQPPRNEDATAYDDMTLVLADGATDKNGILYDGESGGHTLSRLAVQAALGSTANGPELVNHVTEQVRDLYRRHNPRALDDPAYRAATTLAVARLTEHTVAVTVVGDSYIRVNGHDVLSNPQLVDELMVQLRQHYIQLTGDVAGSRDVIFPWLEKQYRYQNNAGHPLGYGVIDGSPVPTKFIQTKALERSQVKTLELVSDGYDGSFPKAVSIAAYEAMYADINREDPDRWLTFLNTKSRDDRTVMIARIAK